MTFALMNLFLTFHVSCKIKLTCGKRVPTVRIKLEYSTGIHTLQTREHVLVKKRTSTAIRVLLRVY